MIALLVAAACLATLLTVGRTAAAETQLLARIETSGARLISAQDTSGASLIAPASVSVIGASSAVERAVALSLPADARIATQGAGGTKIALWEAQGDLEDAVELVSGRLPGIGEAVISVEQARIAGLDGPVGAVETAERQWSVVGIYRARPPFDELDAGVLAPAEATTSTPQLYVIARSAADVPFAADLVRRVIAPSGPGDLTVSAPDALAALQGDLTADLGGLGHSLLLLILGGGAVLVALVTFADTLVRRDDLGRRRALGMSRNALIAFIIVRTAVAAVGGAALGMIAGSVTLGALATAPPPDFVAAVGLLAVIAALAASVPPALAAAYTDPVRVLRTP